MENIDYYDLEKEKAETCKEGEIIEGFKVDFVSDGIILVEDNYKKCGQQLRLHEALSNNGVCENCI